MNRPNETGTNARPRGVAKLMYLVLGILSLVVGLIGVALPLLPTTPFILLSAFCFSHSSDKLHQWLLSNRVFGEIVRDWENHGAIGLKAKWISTLGMAVLMSYPIIFHSIPIFIKCVIGLTCISVLTFIWTRPSGA